MSKVKTDMTIVFRVDTIDRVSLQPRLIGFSALKLFSDVKGRQVMKENSKANLFLNSGIYMLPIYYGLLAPSITVTEDAFDLLPKVPDSFLKVRLFDPTLQEDLNNEDYTNLHRSDSNQPVDSSGSPVRISADSAHDDNFVSIVTALVTSPSFLSHDIKDVPEKSIQSIFYGLPLKPTERSIVVDRFSHWGRARYSSLEIWNFDDMRNKNTGLLDLKYSLSYNDRSGAAIALDMLYNMPLRKNIMRSTAASSTVKAIRSGLARGWDTRVNCYKTAFRYLQGEEDMPDSNNEQGLKSSFDFTEHGQWIVDDASMELDVNSYEAYPMYKDDFSSTASLKLTSNSCLLVIVTAVDVLTTKTSVIGAESAFNSTQLKYSMRIKETDHNSSSVFSPRISERSSSFKSMEEKKEKLKGLIGIHIGHQEPESTWWGLLPLMLKSPFVSPTEDDAVDTVDAVSLSKFGERNKSAAPIDSYCPATESSEGFPLKKNHSGALISREKEINSIYFANIGTHQVPLFQGMPPEDLISSAKPMKWLIEMLKDQHYVDGNFIEPRFSFFYPVRRLFGSQSKEMKRLKKKRKKYNFRCSLGSSAIVRLGDYRHKELINNKIEQLDNLNCVMNDETLFRILRATAVRYAQSGEQKEIGGTTTEMSETSTIALPSGRTAEGCVDHRGMFIVDNNLLAKQMNQFKYKPYNKLPVARTIKSAIPQNIDAEMLVREMNQKFCQAISE